MGFQTHLTPLLARSMRSKMAILPWAMFSVVVISVAGMNGGAIVAGLLFFIAIYGVVALQNDMSDRVIDAYNKRATTPLAAEVIPDNILYAFMLFLSGIATICGVVLGGHALLVAFLYMLLGWVYSGPLDVKSRGFAAAALLGVCYGALPWLLGFMVAQEPVTPILVGVVFISWLYTTAIVVLKDFKDLAGDRRFSKRTLLVQKGAVFVRRYYLLGTTLAYVLLVVIQAVYGNGSYAAAIVACGVVNMYLLADRRVTTQSKFRAVRGSIARVVFYGCIAMTLVSVAP